MPRTGSAEAVGGVVDVLPAALLAANLPALEVPRLEPEHVLEEALAPLGVARECAHLVEALDGGLGRDVRADRDERLVG